MFDQYYGSNTFMCRWKHVHGLAFDVVLKMCDKFQRLSIVYESLYLVMAKSSWCEMDILDVCIHPSLVWLMATSIIVTCIEYTLGVVFAFWNESFANPKGEVDEEEGHLKRGTWALPSLHQDDDSNIDHKVLASWWLKFILCTWTYWRDLDRDPAKTPIENGNNQLVFGRGAHGCAVCSVWQSALLLVYHVKVLCRRLVWDLLMDCYTN